jgi:pilus assembly protein Flp/PilA
MTHSLVLLRALHADRRGVTALEYALIAGVLGSLLVAGFTAFGTDLQSALTSLAASIPGT